MFHLQSKTLNPMQAILTIDRKSRLYPAEYLGTILVPCKTFIRKSRFKILNI